MLAMQEQLLASCISGIPYILNIAENCSCVSSISYIHVGQKNGRRSAHEKDGNRKGGIGSRLVFNYRL
jgi:hypothetical protein